MSNYAIGYFVCIFFGVLGLWSEYQVEPFIAASFVLTALELEARKKMAVTKDMENKHGEGNPQ